MLFTKRNRTFYKFKQFPILLHTLPVNPSYLVVLAIRIIISVLGISYLISTINQRHSLAEQHHKKRISYLTFSHLTDLQLSAWPFHATVPGIIITAAILIILLIGFIMSVIIGYHIIQGKAILTGHVVDNSVISRISSEPICRNTNHIFITF